MWSQVLFLTIWEGKEEEGEHHVLELSNHSPAKKLDDRHFPYGIVEYALPCKQHATEGVLRLSYMCSLQQQIPLEWRNISWNTFSHKQHIKLGTWRGWGKFLSSWHHWKQKVSTMIIRSDTLLKNKAQNFKGNRSTETALIFFPDELKHLKHKEMCFICLYALKKKNINLVQFLKQYGLQTMSSYIMILLHSPPYLW